MATLLEQYTKACNYPGRLDESAVAKHLSEYCEALGVKRKIRRLPSNWTLEGEPDLARNIALILEDFAKRSPKAIDARAARAARDARAAIAARDALDAIDAIDARAARAARDARDAIAARAAIAARDALDAIDASDAIAARAAIDAIAARVAIDAIAARVAIAARDARAARDASDARAASDASDASDQNGAVRRFAQWCIYRKSWWWTGELSWLATTAIGAVSLHKANALKWAKPIFETFVAGAWILYWTETTLYWVAKPTMHTEQIDGRKRLHCADGPTLECDVENLYFWHGVMVPAFVVTRPGWITFKHIENEDNAEVRRVMIERYGQARYLVDSGTTKVHADDYGTLYRKEITDDEPLVMVKVINSTAEADGSFKDYFLRVPPTMKTAREAVAWSFGVAEQEYNPVVQT